MTLKIIKDITALIAGAALTLAFAPFSIFPIAIISPAVLLVVLLDTTPKRAFFRGWLYGLGLFGTGVYWVFISIHTYGNASVPLAVFITALFVNILALFPAINGYLLSRYFPQTNSTKILCAFPATWVFLEWIRSWIFSGFPWLFLGYSQINSPLKGYAPILSVYGVSLAVLLCASLLVYASKKNIISTAGIIFIFLIGYCLSMITWTKPDGLPIKASLVQGNIPQEIKWNPDQLQPTLALYEKLTSEHWDSEIIIWPEGAVSASLQEAKDFIESISEKARQHHVALITGIPIQLSQHAYYNAVITLGNGTGLYLKYRLVPFGEYVPLPGIFQRILDKFQIPMSSFISGPPRSKPLLAGNTRIAAFICYEIAFPEQVLMRDGNAGVILTISDDAWFGYSIAQAQHLEMAQMRALEMGRPVLFVSNNGITGFIQPDGSIQSTAPAYKTHVLTDTVQPMQGKTPWMRFAMDPILGILIILLGIAILRRKII